MIGMSLLHFQVLMMDLRELEVLVGLNFVSRLLKRIVLSYIWIGSYNNTPPPPDGVSPSDWQFGPSFSTHKIVFIARAVSLV